MATVLLLTGVPGTGKTTLAAMLSKDMDARLISLNHVVDEQGLWSGTDEFGTRIVDMLALESYVNAIISSFNGKLLIIEGHLGCDLNLMCDVIVVTRTNPKILKKRLKQRGYKGKKLKDNLMAEFLDYATINALERYVNVYEIDTTHQNPEESIREIKKILKGRGERYGAGWVDWSSELEQMIGHESQVA